MLDMSRQLQDQFKDRLQSSGSCMLPSYSHTLPSGEERGTFLALDVGGSTLRVALVELSGRRVAGNPMTILGIDSFRIGEQQRRLEGVAFFDWMAERIAEMLGKYGSGRATGSTPLSTGLAWSFPIEQTSLRTGSLIGMGKGFLASQGLVGKDLGALITEACQRRNVNIRMDAILNDSSATLLSRAYQDETTRMALILGTGTNAAIHLPVSALGHGKFGNRPQSWHDKATHVLVNTELSMFGKNVWVTTRWDDYLNATHILPDFQPFEHLIGGRYLGEIVRLILVEAIETAGLFDGEMPLGFNEPYSLDTGTIAGIEADDSPTLATACTVLQNAHPLLSPPRTADLLFVRHVCQLVSRRAAAYLATGIHALWSLRNTAERFSPAAVAEQPLSISYDGSVLEKYPGFKDKCQAYIDTLVDDGGHVSLEPAVESAILGAAVAVGCVEAERAQEI
ncbi:MAG: hypothetical protein M1819_007349 [Sarea resinae]|nr:MAG: hypothetical protein M1819_007349 [Sarea resinae]